MSVTRETQMESYNKIVNNLGEKQILVYIHLNGFTNGATARELAVSMHSRGIVASPERNSVHPRLNELIRKELVEVTGKKVCDYTNKKVAIYKVKEFQL